MAAIRLSRSRPSSTEDGSAGQESAVARSTRVADCTVALFQSLVAKVLCHAYCSYPCHATLRRFLRLTLRRLRFVARLLRDYCQPYLDTKGTLMPAPYPIPGLSTHPDHARPNTISPHIPGSARKVQHENRRAQCPQGSIKAESRHAGTLTRSAPGQPAGHLEVCRLAFCRTFTRPGERGCSTVTENLTASRGPAILMSAM